MGKKIGFAAGQEHDFELALLALGKHGTGDLDLFPIGGSVGELERTAAADLEAIVKYRAVCERVDAKAGLGVIDLDELDGSAGAVLDGGVDVVGVAGGGVEGAYRDSNQKESTRSEIVVEVRLEQRDPSGAEAPQFLRCMTYGLKPVPFKTCAC